MIFKWLIKIIFVLAFCLLFSCEGKADVCKDASGYSCGQIVDAIYIIEGGKNTSYPYGIQSVKCDSLAECRQVCFNTVKNNVARWQKARQEGYKEGYLTFLWYRYCPPSAHPLNQNWKRNLLNQLEKAK